MLRFSGRPHWAKDYHIGGDEHFARLYPRWHDFKALRERLDPDGTFLNAHLRATLGLPIDAVAARAARPGGGDAAEAGAVTDGATSSKGDEAGAVVALKAAAEMTADAGGEGAPSLAAGTSTFAGRNGSDGGAGDAAGVVDAEPAR